MINKFDTFHFKGLDGIDKYNFSFEDYENKLTSFLYEEIEKSIEAGNEMTNDMIQDIRDEYIDSQVEDLSTELNSDRFIRLEQEHKQQTEKKDKQKKIKQLQQYFTGPEEIQKLIDLSGIIYDDDRTLQILEPTAGYGAIVKALIELEDDNNEMLDMSIDMVEFDKENRVELERLISLAPDILSISLENNFLRFQPSKRYDYIIANPPFHLKSKTNTIYTRDVYDTDFIMRAYTMLKPDGVLVAIISTRWNTIDDEISKDFREFIGTIDAKFEYEDLLIKDWSGSKTYNDEDDVNVSKISNLKISMIKLTKTGDDSDYCNTLLMEQVHLFNDDVYDKAIKLMEDTGNLNIVVEEVDEEDNEEDEEINKDKKPKNNKELIQSTIDLHNDKPIKNKEIKKDDYKYNNKNHLTTKSTRRGGLDTEDEIKHRLESTKIEEYDKSNNRKLYRENVRLEHNFF